MIIGRKRFQCRKCDIRSSFTQFHPAGVLRNPAPFKHVCGRQLIGGLVVLLPFSGAPSLRCASSLSFTVLPWKWLTDQVCDWQDQCSRTVFTRDHSRSHMTPGICPRVSRHCITVSAQDRNTKSQSVTEVTVCAWTVACHNQMLQSLWFVDAAPCEHTKITQRYEV